MKNFIFKSKTKKGIGIIIRYPRLSDTKALCDYINKLSREKTFITFQGEKIAFNFEKEYLKNQLAEIKKNNAVNLMVFSGDKIVGNSGINLKKKSIFKHVGSFGISIAKDYRGQGIGKLLMNFVLNEAKENLKGLRIIELQVFSNNPTAIKLYEKLGFKKFGVLPKGILHKEKFVDEIFMYKNVK